MHIAKKIFYSLLLFLIIVDFFVSKEESLFLGQNIPGFMAAYGLISCILIIVVSKVIGYLGISKREDYYDV